MAGIDWTKRAFLRAMGGSLPSLKLALAHRMAAQSTRETQAENAKFLPVDCGSYYNASPADVKGWEQIPIPSGLQRFRGIPFLLGGKSDASDKKWIALSQSTKISTAKVVEIPIGRAAQYFCLAQFCDWDSNEQPEPDGDALEKVGQELARLTLKHEGGEHVQVIRRRFEVSSLTIPWGHLCFSAVPHRADVARRLIHPLRNALEWGDLQMTSWSGDYPGPQDDRATLWISAIENPAPHRVVNSIRLEGSSEDTLFVCGITLFQGKDHPLKYERLAALRVELPPGTAYSEDRWTAEVDLGSIARVYPQARFEGHDWLSYPAPGLAEVDSRAVAESFVLEITASRDATLTVEDKHTSERYEFSMREVYEDSSPAKNHAARVQFLDPHKTWLHAQVADRETGRPTPVRIAFRSSDGRYIAPYGHRTEINTGWFQDYGADIKMGGSSFAYVDGSFQIELPVGDVFVEISKGFEYEPVRRKIHVQPGQRELYLEVARFFDLRSKNWVSADTHVHFLSPATAILEGQAEGLNLINLLAAQWGDLFTNVGDLHHGAVSSTDGDMLVCPGTENRQHILGHLGILGVHADPVFPMSASGPEEGYIGTPLWSGLCEWADRSREHHGLAVAVHFPYPTGEIAAAIALNKIDAVELWPVEMSEHFNNLRFQDWYRYLNCGYRLPAVAGTDKMGAWIPAGAYRAYAQLGSDEFNFQNWAKAVRAGNTFMSSGPLLLFQADGLAPGSEIRMAAPHGSIEVRAEARSAVPIHTLEIVLNGKVVTARTDNAGARMLTLQERIRAESPGWIAARCASRLATPGFRVVAHTSPLYVTRPGAELFSAPVASYILKLIDGAETWATQLATRPDATTFERTLHAFKAARERVLTQMHQHHLPR